MSKSPLALVDPKLLVWARESAQLDREQVASSLKVDENRVTSWETGEDRPSIAQLRKLADAYHRPVAVFFLPEPPRDFNPLRDFRRVPNEKSSVSEALQADLRRAWELRDAAIALMDEEADDSVKFGLTASLDDDADDVAELLRKNLNVSDEDQLGWSDSYEALREWRLAVEALGVLVINMSGVEVNDARGFSIAEFPLPLIALNAKDTPNGRVFTLMHELAHLALHEGGICEWARERRLAADNRKVETFCNRVAAALLLPESLVIAVVSQTEVTAPGDWTDEILKRHARSLCVSEEALLRRLVSLELASQELYDRKRFEYLRRYQEAAKKRSKPIVSFAKRVVGRLGTAYLDLAFTAYYDKRLTLSELSSYTGVRVHHLGRIEREAFGMSRVPGGTT
jgi:Zn-dependent peptidase ImmA (M78 family)/DNA-binding XRE family transcriptional regulator